MLPSEKLMAKNRLYTKSYFAKRLKDAEFKVDRLEKVTFQPREGDNRYWMMVVDPGGRNLVVTCRKNSPEDFSFQIVGPTNVRVVTHSMDVVIEQLKKLCHEPKTK